MISGTTRIYYSVTRVTREKGSNPAVVNGKQWLRDCSIDVPATPTLSDATFAAKKLSTGQNGQKADA